MVNLSKNMKASRMSTTSLRLLFTFFVYLFSFHQAQSQIPINTFNQKEKAYFKTLIKLANYLRKEKTSVMSFHETETYSDEEKFYDKVIDIFFAKQKMLRGFKKDTSVFAVAGKMDVVRHELNSIDIQLDSLDEKSILIEPIRYTKKSKGKDLNNAFNIFLKTGKKRNLFRLASLMKAQKNF